MHADGGRGVHVRVSCWLSAADGASEPCDIGAVGASASLVLVDGRTDGGTDPYTIINANFRAHIVPNWASLYIKYAPMLAKHCGDRVKRFVQLCCIYPSVLLRRFLLAWILL